eukprot:m.40669 g.40669  ORF g.40669 m.40669 type:complete len:517 (-) comp14847_c0_seq1:469-2019(-)
MRCRYVSTRRIQETDTADTADTPVGVSWEEAICAGYAPDGGLFVPATIPEVSQATLMQWSGLPFPDLCTEVMSLFIGDEIPKSDLRDIAHAAFSQAQWDCDAFVPLRTVGGTYVAELFHGPSLSFKDFGQQMLCKMLDYFAVKGDRNITLVVSTTGDTGPAALRATAGAKRLKIICTYPKGQVSRCQELQMTTVRDPDCVRVYAFEGGGDDMDGPIKRVTSDPSFKAKYGLTSVNSINLGRVTVQTVHYFFAYFRAIERSAGLNIGDDVAFCIPTGAMGNVTAGELARRMGLPIAKLCCGVNENDIVHRAMSRGEFWKQRMVRTLSEAINIQVPYNFERLLYLWLESNPSEVRKHMECMESEGRITLPQDTLKSMQTVLLSAVVTDDQMLETMRSLKENTSYLVDPHTAVAMHCRGQLEPNDLPEKTPIIVLATAHPCKFEVAVRRALGNDFWSNEMVSPRQAVELQSHSEVGGVAGGCVLGATSGDSDENGVPVEAKAGGAWEHTLRELIEGICV